MGEQLKVNPMPERQVGDSFQPFKDLTVFPEINITDGCSQEVFAHKFVFKDVVCSLSVNVFEPEELFSKKTPLGKIRVVKSAEGGKETVEELPITLYLGAKVPSFEKFKELEKYALEIELKDKKYYLSFGGDDKFLTEENFEGNEEVDDFCLKNEEGENVEIALPFNPDLIRDLQVSLVQKDMGPNRTWSNPKLIPMGSLSRPEN